MRGKNRKYELNNFAVYKGFTFDTYGPRHGYIGLLTEDEKLAKKFDFLQDDDGYYKEVSPYEVTEYYEQRFKAVYKDIPVSIIVGDDDSVEIENTNLPWAVLKKAGFDVVNKGEYSKLVKTSELTDLHAERDDNLEYAKKDFDEANKKKDLVREKRRGEKVDLIGIKIKSKDKDFDCIKILRKFSEMSVGEIKEKIQNDDFVFECSYTDGDALVQVILLYKEFCASKIDSEIFEHGRLTDIDFLENLLNTYKEIDEESFN